MTEGGSQGRGQPVHTLPASWYHGEDIYEKERQNIFASEWLLFAHEAMLPKSGSYIAQTIAGYPVLVIRAQDGSLKAFHNVCRHRASMIVEEGVGQTQSLRCMYHGWVYDTDGQLQKAPDFGGDEASLCARMKLFSIHLEIWNNLVFVCLSDRPPDFQSALGDLPAVIRDINLGVFEYHSVVKHSLVCNWKVYAENYAEGYHIPYVHPGLNKEVDMATYKVVTGEKIAQHLSEPRAERQEDAINDGLWVWFWPHAALNVYKEGMNLELMVPTGPETVELQYYYLFRDLSNGEDIPKTVAMSREVTAEDVKICEIVQKNLRSGIYDRGELSPRHESGVAYFQTLIKEALS